MKRRNLLLGLGAVVSGSAGAMGTGAFSAARLDNRVVDISVVNDADGLIGLVPNGDIAGVDDDDGGKLSISLDNHGINVDSLYQFGAFVDDSEFPADQVGDQFDPVLYSDDFDVEGNFRSAFAIVNQTDRGMDVSLSLEIGTGANEGTPSFVFQLHDGNDQLDAISSPNTLSAEVDLGPGEAVGVSFSVDTSDSEVGDDLSGALSLSATESGA